MRALGLPPLCLPALVLPLALLWPVSASGQGLLTSTTTLASRLGQVTVVDVRDAADYRSGHVPGALRLDARPIDPVVHAPAALAELLGAQGVSDRAEVVVVGGGRASWGLDGRVVWLLDWLGHERVSMLDGGFGRWQAEGRAVARGEAPTPARVSFRARPRLETRVGTDELVRLRQQPGVVVLDVRSDEEWAGKMAYGAPRTGRIPGARHLDWNGLFTAQGTVDTSAAARARLAGLGIGGSSPVVVYCHEGWRSGAAVVALRTLGVKKVLHYDAAWNDWSRRRDLPVEK